MEMLRHGTRTNEAATLELHGIASCMLGTVKILKSSSFCVYRLPFSFVSIIQCLLRVGQGAQQLSSVTKVVISYDWHPHEHCSFVESANDGKVELKEKETPRINSGMRIQAQCKTCHRKQLWEPLVLFNFLLVGWGNRHTAARDKWMLRSVGTLKAFTQASALT